MAAGCLRSVAFVAALFAVGSAWAATWSHAGYVSVDSANPTAVFTGVSLSDLGTKFSVNGAMGGSSISSPGPATTYSYTTGENKLTVEFRKVDGNDTQYCKAVTVEFTEATADNVTTISAVATAAKYVAATSVDTEPTETGTPVSSATAAGYGIYGLYLLPIDSTITRVAAPKVAYSENFPSATTTVTTRGESITFYPANGASVSDGVITVSSASGSTGPAFETASGNAAQYVSMIFTADFTDVTLEDGDMVFSFGNSTANYVGVKLASSGDAFYATAIWNNGNYTGNQDTSNTFTLSGEQTFLATYGQGLGTYLYVLDGNQVKTLYAGPDTKGNNLSLYRFGIGGGYGSYNNGSRIGNMKLKACSLFTSNAALPVTATTFPAYVNSMTTVADGATTSISALNTAAPCVVTVAAGAMVNIDATPASTVYFTDESAFAMDGYGRLWKYDVTANLKNGGKVRLPYTDVSTTLASIEDGGALVLTGDTDNTGSLAVTLPTGANGANINATIIRKDGGYCTGTWDGTDAYTYNSTINTAICGSSTVFDWTFTNTFNYAYAASGIGNNNDGGTSARAWNNTLADKSTGLMLTTRPYTSGNFLTSERSAAMTLVVVGQMPSADNTFYLYLGSTSAKGLFLSTTSTKNEVLVAWNDGTTVNAITTMMVPNAATTRHVYAITKEDKTIDDVAKSVFTVYLDGTKWKTLVVDKLDITTGGVQCGADFGGGIRGKDTNVSGKTIRFQGVAAGDTGYLNTIRLFGSVLTEDTIARLSDAEEYPYSSPYGNSKRTFTADGNWLETESTPWTNTPNGGVDTASGSPLEGSSLTVTTDNASGVTVSVNLDEDKTYEALTLTGDPIAFEFAEGKTGKIKATGAITISAETTIKAGALEVGGSTTIVGDGSLLFDYADYDASGVTYANPQTVPLVLASMDEQEEGKVTCTVPTTPHRSYSFGYANGGYNLAITAYQAMLNGTDKATFAAALEEAVANDTVGINEDVTVADLELDKDITLDLGTSTFTVTGSITGEGALTLTGTGTLKVPVGTTIPNLTSTGDAKIAVTGTVAKGTTLFTITSGTYANERVGTDNGDVHYTVDGSAYKAGKVFYWAGATNALYWNTANWVDSSDVSTGEEYPILTDTAIFDSSKATGTSLRVGQNIISDIEVKSDFEFLLTDGTDNETHTIGTASTSFDIAQGATARINASNVRVSSSQNASKTLYLAADLTGKGKLLCDTNSGKKGGIVAIRGDTSAFEGEVEFKQNNGATNGACEITSPDAANNVKSAWTFFTSNNYQAQYTTFNNTATTYYFGAISLLAYERNNGHVINRVATFNIGGRKEDSIIKGQWPSSYKPTINWTDDTATFTQSAKNTAALNITGGGYAYISASATENAAAEYVPTQLNFTDNGGYLLFDDDNVSIGGSILAAVNTKTAGVGLNAATDEAITVTAGVLSGTDFKKKGAGKITLTGAFTDLGTVTVTEGQLVFEATEALTAYANGENTSVSISGTTYTFFPAKVNATTAAGVSSGYETVAEAVTAAGVGGTITLLANDSSESIALLGGQTLLLNGFTLAATPTAPAAADGNAYRIDAVVENEETIGYTATVTATTWTDSSGDHKWTTASNWSSGVVPTKDTAITFPAGNDPENLATYTVYLDSDNCVCASMIVNGVPTIYQDNMAINVTKKIFVYGDVTGSGTLKMHYVGINNASGATKTVSVNIEVLKPEANENADSWFEGSVFTFSGTINIPGKMCSYSQHIFTGTINVTGVEFYGSEDQFITGGTVNISSGKMQVGLSNKAKWIKASANAVFNLNDGGLLNVCRITADGAYTFNFNGGTLASYGAGSANGKIIGGDSADKATITVNVSANSTITNATDTAIAPALNDTSDNASPVITKAGAGKLTLSATPAATIGFALAGGSLVIPNAYEGSVSVAPTLVYTKDIGEANTTWTITGNAVASVDGVGYATLADAIADAGSDKVITLYADITEAINLKADQQIKIAFNDYELKKSETVDIFPAAGQQVGWIVIDGVSTVVSTANTASTWTDVTNDHVWDNDTNWSTGFVPTSSTAVTIPDGEYTIYLRDSGDVARSLVVNGNATLRYSSDNWAKWPYLTVNGDITGTGSLTLYRAGIQANAMVNVSCDFIFDGPNTSKDTFVSGNSQSDSGWNFTKSVTFSAGALSKVESLAKMPGGVTFNCPLTIGSGAAYTCVSDITIGGTTTLNGDFTKQGNGRLTLGDVTVAAASSITKSGGSMTFGGTTTVSGDYAFTLPSGLTIGEDASFVLGSSGATIVSSTDISGKVSSGVTGYDLSTATDTPAAGQTTYSLVLDYVPVDGSTGTITVTGDSIKLAFNNASGMVTLSCASEPTVTVYATDGTGAKTSIDISGAFKVTSNGDGTYTVALDSTKTVDEVSVTPTVDTTAEKPMDVSADKVGLTMKTIPGLWYGLAASGTVNGTYYVGDGDNAVKQADGSSLTLSAALDSEATVQFYRVKTGASKAALDAEKAPTP